jgi:hypothetical protein
MRDRLESVFERGAGHGLLELGIREVGTALPPDFAYWRDFAGRYVTALCTSAQPTGSTSPMAAGTVEAPAVEMLAELVNAAPPMPGGEYLNADVLAALWEGIDAACRAELAAVKQTLQDVNTHRMLISFSASMQPQIKWLRRRSASNQVAGSQKTSNLGAEHD